MLLSPGSKAPLQGGRTNKWPVVGVLAAILAFAALSPLILAQVVDSAPVTTKTYGQPSEPALIAVPTCDGAVEVNGHVISTETTVTLSAEDESETLSLYSLLVPADCEEGDEVEWVGLTDHGLYQDSELCALAVDEAGTEEAETQECAETWWNPMDESSELEGGFAVYEEPFTIPEESLHKICFFSIDEEENVEELQCQIALVDDAPPELSASADREVIDLENYYGSSGGYMQFYDPKCTLVTAEASDTHEFEVRAQVGEVLHAMLADLAVGEEQEEALAAYFADSMHDEPLLQQGDGNWQYWFCPGKHLYHLNSMEVLDGDAFGAFLSEDLLLGSFDLPIVARDAAGRVATVAVPITIVDLTVPLEEGWNLRSTPIRLEGNAVVGSDAIDAVLKWDSESQGWELVTDGSMAPLEAYYFHATDRGQLGLIFERGLTSPPLRELSDGWNLVGMALQLSDSWASPYHYCDNPFDGDSYDEDGGWGDYYAGGCYLSSISTEYSAIGEGFGPVIYDANGNRALAAVISPEQYLSYGDDWASWYFSQYGFVWLPRITEDGADPENYWDQYLANFGGYWALLQNSASLPGFTTTPLPVSGD